ncbi:glutathione S-transferase [Actimicrobium sp. CCC2.4]|uniref:glutathione S-transferase n=1 Tax=Actimicrobium sp. CCC2.4 TaxID=3048606 RepID=UPI002AC97E8A|nr:glutathione S-transferase [Actimicrobium sp. CCC2.4]MEB0137290.1 glutathione S-transferase [Actimicrobium sp. CCC2.4]WPX32528.1 glutathione S-transferase [Actimicrobium sp. CCC2.4]
MKIYDFKGFPSPARVRIALAEKGLTDRVEFVHVNVPAGEHKLPAFVAKNPSAAVPVLELDDGTMIAGSTDITAFVGPGFADFAKIAIPADLASLHEWRARIAARPGVKAS